MLDEPAAASLIAYLAQTIARASTVIATRPASDPQHPLALGEVVSLFNLADEFGLIVSVRKAADGLTGRDTYGQLSTAMKSYYLGVPERGQATSASRHRSHGQRPSPPSARSNLPRSYSDRPGPAGNR